MRQGYGLTLLLGALLGATALAQPGRTVPPTRQPAAYNYDAMLGLWYQHFLDRQIDAYGRANWMQRLRAGTAPRDILTTIITSDEYRQRTGGSITGLVQGLLIDLTGQRPDAATVQRWVQRAQQTSPEQAAAELLDQHRATWSRMGQPALPQQSQPQPRPEEIPREQIIRQFRGASVREEIDDLQSAVEELQDEIMEEEDVRTYWKLYRQADEVIAELRELRRAIARGEEDRLTYKRFREMDEQLHGLLDAARRAEPRRGLLYALAKVRRADNRLHYALNLGVEDRGRRSEVTHRQAQSLVSSAEALNRTASYVLRNDREGRHLEKTIGTFVRAADGFHRSYDAKLSEDRLRRSFGEVGEAWNHVVRDINELSHQPGYRHLHRQAQSVDEIYLRLHETLGMQGEHPRVTYQYRFPERR